MRDIGKIVLHIPAREGSKRVARKNMRLMDGKPMISYVIEAALSANITDDSYVNTDSEEIIEYVKATYPAFKIYLRDKELCNDTTQSDHFNADIIRKLQPDTLIMINPVCPLIEPGDIVEVVEAYKNSNCDALITSSSTQMQTFCDGKPVNININQRLGPSQSNPVITTLNWAVSIWEAKPFINRMDEKGFAVWGERTSFHDISSHKALKVSEEEDFLFAEKMLKLKRIS